MSQNIVAVIRRVSSELCLADDPSRNFQGKDTAWRDLYTITQQFPIQLEEYVDMIEGKNYYVTS